MLLRLANDLVETLYIIPEPHALATRTEPRHLRTAEEVLEDLWLSRSTAGRHEGSGTTSDSRSTSRTARQNRLLFESLREHTRERVSWGLLDRWKAAWDVCSGTLHELKEKTEREVNHLLDQSSALGAAARAGGVQKAAETIALAIVEALWQTLTAARERDEAASFKAAPGSGNAVAVYGRTSISVSLASVEEALSAELAQVCNEAITAIRQSHTLEWVPAKLEELHRIARQLEEDLDPLLLRPLILRTRCDLCPA
ncbi:MAG: hypothetical protein SVP26_10925 [Chloroflexota bacterium]|nr:hypothetical protein [Chloroflexota bacterium]